MADSLRRKEMDIETSIQVGLAAEEMDELFGEADLENSLEDGSGVEKGSRKSGDFDARRKSGVLEPRLTWKCYEDQTEPTNTHCPACSNGKLCAGLVKEILNLSFTIH